MSEKIKRFCAWAILIGLFSIGLQAKNLEEYGIENRHLEAYLVENGFEASASINEIIASEERFEQIRRLYPEVWSEIRASDNLEEIQKLTELYVTGINTSYRSYVLSRMWLPPFKPEYFNEAAKETLRTPDKPNVFAYDYIHALGIAGVDHPDIDLDQYIKGKTLEESLKLPPILERAGDSHRYLTSSWAARVVLARRGDKDALDGVLEVVSGMDDLKLRELSEEVLTNMGYIRQPETIDILIKVLSSDFGTPDNPYPDYIANRPGVRPFAYNAVKPLALAFDDFPIDYWQPTITEQDLKIARTYIHNYLNPDQAVEIPERVPIFEAFRMPQTASGPEEVEVTKEPKPAIKKTAEVTEAETSEEPAEKSSNWWLWLIGLLVVVGGLVVVVRRKS